MSEGNKIKLGKVIVKTAMSELGFHEATSDNFIAIANTALNKIQEFEDPGGIKKGVELAKVEKTEYYTTKKYPYIATSKTDGKLNIHAFKTKKELNDFVSPRIDPIKQKQADEITEKLAQKTPEEWLKDANEFARVIEDEPIKTNLSPRPTPNCSICQWNKIEMRIDPDTPDNLDKYFENCFGICTAQGLTDTDECYNSPECKRLFQTEKSPIKRES